MALGARKDGILTVVIHEAVQETLQSETCVEIVVNRSGQQDKCSNVRLDDKLARMDTHTPLDRRLGRVMNRDFAEYRIPRRSRWIKSLEA